MKHLVTIHTLVVAGLGPVHCALACPHRHPLDAGWCRLVGQRADGVRPLACLRLTGDAPMAYARAPARKRGAPYPKRICRVCGAEFEPRRENGSSLPTRCPKHQVRRSQVG